MKRYLIAALFISLSSVGMYAADTIAPNSPRIEITELQPPPATDVPVIPWVAANDDSWQQGKPVFEIAHETTELKAKGWFAVTQQAILLHIVVTDNTLVEGGSANSMTSADSIQVAIDALGDSSDKPPVLDVEKWMKKKYGEVMLPMITPVAPNGKVGDWQLSGVKKQVEAERTNLEKNNKVPVTNGIFLRRSDADYAIGLVKGEAKAWSYYHGQRNEGRPWRGSPSNIPAKVVRDEAAKTTTYDASIPWSDFGTSAGPSFFIKVAVQINDADPGRKEPHRIFWGGGLGGKFMPFLFKKLALGNPPGPVATSWITEDVLKSADCYVGSAPVDYAEAVFAVTDERAAKISAQMGAVSKVLDIPAAKDKPTLHRFSVRAYPGTPLKGSVAFRAALTADKQPPLAQTNVRIFDESTSNWYVFKPESDLGPSVIGMNDWLDKPAGRHGFVQAKGDRLICEDGTPIKLWGTVVGSPVLDNKSAEALAAMLEKYGINAVRFMPVGSSNMVGLNYGIREDATQFDPVKLDRLDYLMAQLKQHGVYSVVCVNWAGPPGTKDQSKIWAYDEVMAAAKAKGFRLEGLECFAPDIQDMHIAAAVNFLTHKNPYTGLTPGTDPGLAYYEFQNESDIFWYGLVPALQTCPTYRKYLCQQFCAWLKSRYGSQENLVKAWGTRCLGTMTGCDKDESLDKENLQPAFGGWWFSPEGVEDQDKHWGARPRLMDTARFLFDTQNKYYERFAKAVRATGFKGALVTSNFETGGGVGQYYNILSDSSIGIVDRHNYFGSNDLLRLGLHDNSSQLTRPGSGLLSHGFERVVSAPFGFSEWTSTFPNEWTAESPMLMGAYGLGLQGWNTSFHFIYPSSLNMLRPLPPIVGTTVNGPQFFYDTIEGFCVWNFATPVQMGLYPALARMVHRGDVKKGEIVSARKISMENLNTGQFDFTEKIAQSGDFKEITGQVPSEAMALGRVVIEYVDKTEPSTFPHMDEQLKNRSILSNTGQLQWDFATPETSHFSINTDGTKALVGFVPKQEYTLGDIKMSMDNKFGILVVTALEKDKTLANCKSALIMAVSRGRNTGMEFDDVRGLETMGHAPVLLEPIFGSLTFTRKVSKVFILDHDGRRTTNTLTLDNGRVAIDGSVDKTLYYEAVFE